MSDTPDTPPSSRDVHHAHLRARRWCGVCGTELEAYSGRGRPPRYCPADVRPCAQIVRTIASFRAQADAILRSAPANKRETVLRGMRGTLRQISQDLTLTTAQLDGDTSRAAAVGRADPSGFCGD